MAHDVIGAGIVVGVDGPGPCSVAEIEAGTKVGAGTETGAGNGTVIVMIMEKQFSVSRSF